MSYSGGVEDMVANNVGAGFVGALVHMGSHQSFVNIIHFVPHILIFLMTLFLGALVGVFSFSTLFLTFFLSFFTLIALQKIGSLKVAQQTNYPKEVFKRT